MSAIVSRTEMLLSKIFVESRRSPVINEARLGPHTGYWQ
jgi:hypothetical protein